MKTWNLSLIFFIIIVIYLFFYLFFVEIRFTNEISHGFFSSAIKLHVLLRGTVMANLGLLIN